MAAPRKVLFLCTGSVQPRGAPRLASRSQDLQYHQQEDGRHQRSRLSGEADPEVVDLVLPDPGAAHAAAEQRVLQDLVHAGQGQLETSRGHLVERVPGVVLGHDPHLPLDGLEVAEQEYVESPRVGDHVWWVSDVSKFRSHFPGWRLTRDVRAILREIHDANLERWARGR